MTDTKTFILNGTDFCCTSAAIRDGLIYHGYSIINVGRYRGDETRKCYFFRIDDDMIPILEEYLGKTVIWAEKIK